jgi:N-acetylglucosamine kinase-like BadF-type ATPase
MSAVTTPFVVGVDLGGTKTHVGVAGPDAVATDVVRPSGGWNPRPWDDGARWVTAVLDDAHPAWRAADAVVIGAHGSDSPAHAVAMRDALRRVAGRDCVVVNDAELVLPAAGLSEGVGVIAGTGSVAAGHRDGEPTVTVGGWGWLLGDEGSAPTLVREAIRAVVERYERGEPSDPLGDAMLRAFEAPSPPELLVAASTRPGIAGWAPHAPAVFRAVQDGSADALAVVRQQAAALAELVVRLHGRGVPTADVVVAGGVARHQPLLVEGIATALREQGLACRVQTLRAAPVTGALVLAARAAGWADLPPAVDLEPVDATMA